MKAQGRPLRAIAEALRAKGLTNQPRGAVVLRAQGG
jgi:hypothetical protein